jgi:hypothetical protein
MDQKHYNRWNPIHWFLAVFSNSRKSEYLKEGTAHVAESKYKATQRLLYWIRNPAHDFSNYIIGFYGDPLWRAVYEYRVQEALGLRAALYARSWARFPWASYSTRWVYMEAGWGREGAFELKLRRASKGVRDGDKI